jgi:hypothetical protein
MPRTNNAQTKTEEPIVPPVAAEAPETPTTDAASAPTLQVQDLQNLLQVVDYAAEQGAFKGWSTISQVFAVRQKLNAFLQSVAPKTDATESKAESGNLDMGAVTQQPAAKEEKVTKLPRKKKGS